MTTQDKAKAIHELEQRISSDHGIRESFLKDAAAVMHQHGITLAPDQAKHVNEFIESQLRIPNSHVTGASIRPGTDRAEVEVTVSVGVKF